MGRAAEHPLEHMVDMGQMMVKVEQGGELGVVETGGYRGILPSSTVGVVVSPNSSCNFTPSIGGSTV